MTALSDPNWLLSSTAQSAAALVAIVGGFLVSRVIAFKSDKDGTNRRLHSTVSALESAETEETVAGNELATFRQELEAEQERYEEEDRREEEAGPKRRSSSPYDLNLAVPRLPYVVSIPTQQKEMELEKQEYAAAWRVRQLRTERDQIQRELDSLQVPPDLGRGLRVLLFFAVSGVVFPIVLMANQPEEVAPWVRALVVIGFVAGLLALAWFVASVIADAKRGSDRVHRD